MTTLLADCDPPSGGFDREDATLAIENVVYSGSSPVVQLQGDGTTQRLIPALSAAWDAPSNPYIVGVEFEYAPTDGDGETIRTSPQPQGAEAWKTSNAIVGGATYSVRYRAVGVADTYGPWSTPEDVTVDDDAGPFVGDGEPAFVPAQPTATYQRQDQSEFWRYDDAGENPQGANIVGTNLKTGTNTVTFSGFATDQIVRFSKPLAAASGGLLTWDGFSAWSSDGSTFPVPPPVVGQTWSNEFAVWGSNDSFATHDVLFTAGLDANLYATEAAAFAAISARLPFTTTGYAAYKIVGILDGNPGDNRNGLSVMIEEVRGWRRMSDLDSIEENGSEVAAAPRALNFTGAPVSVTDDGDGHVTVDVDAITGSTGANDNRLLRSDGTGGRTAQASAIPVDDNGGIQLPADFALTGDISPTQITGNLNNYNPTGLATATVLRLSSDASRDITGLQGGADGRLLVLANIGAQNIVLKDESASSTAGNRFALDGDATIGGDQSATLIYDSTSSRWRLIAIGKTTGGGGGIGGSTGATDNRLLRADGTGGATVQPSAISVDDNGGIGLPADLTLSGKITPTQITATTNDYAPTGFSSASVLRLSTDASRNLTGIAGGAEGRVIVVANVGSFDLVLKDESASSSGANRFALEADLTLIADTSATLIYDATASRWRLIAVGRVFSTGAAVTIKDEGSTLTATLTSMNFVGPGVAATASGGDVTVTIGAGGGNAIAKALCGAL